MAASLVAPECPAAVIPHGGSASTGVLGHSGLGTSPEFNETANRSGAPLNPFSASLSRSAEGTHNGTVVARVAATANQTSSLDVQPLRMAVSMDGSATWSASRTAEHPGPGSTSAGGVSDYDLFFEVTDLPAQYTLSGTLYGTAWVELSTGPGAATRVFRSEGAINPSTPVDASRSGTLQPGEYRLRVNVGGGHGGNIPFTGQGSARSDDISFVVSQVPEPASLAALSLSPFILLSRWRRTR